MINLIKLLSDFGLVVLIWIVQIIIYPSFHFYAAKDLFIWHNKYTNLITFIVLPLMFIQLGTTGYITFKSGTTLHIIQLVLIILIWISTFAQAVPLHNKIANDTDGLVYTISQLVKVNWIRTILWTIIFILSFYDHTKELLK